MPDNAFHVFPEDEWRDHKLKGFDCECIPRVSYTNGFAIVSHSAYDHREIIEEAEHILKNAK
jgi:hypothetical protein